MELPTVDPRLSAQQALQDDPVQRKLQIDALRARLAEPGKDDAAARKLKEACQGFESIFLQRIWEQMRKNVAKEGYLHSRDEESYQGMFDQELAKKMAEAGGIGLADMLQEQLSVKLGKASIATSPGMLKAKQQLLPLENLAMPLPTVPGFNDKPKPKAEELYTPLEEEDGKEQAEKQPEGKDKQDAENKEKVAASDSLGTHPDIGRVARNSALSVNSLSPAELAKQPVLGMQPQFLLGASLVARAPSTGNSAVTSSQAMNGAAVSQAESSPLTGMNPAQGQTPGLNQAQAANVTQQNDSLPPLPQLDNNPLANRNTDAPGQLAGAAGQPEETAPQRSERRVPGFGGISMVEDTVKKSHLNPFAQNWPAARTAKSGAGGQNRFAARIGQSANSGQPEAGRAVLEEPSILRPPVRNVGSSQTAHHETEIRDLPPRDTQAEMSKPPQGNAQGAGIRQISQAEVEAAMRRMNN